MTNLLAILVAMMGAHPQATHNLNLPCPSGQVSAFIELYGDPAKPFKVTDHAFVCIPVPVPTPTEVPTAGRKP